MVDNALPPLIDFLSGMTDREEALEFIREKQAQILQELQAQSLSANQHTFQAKLGHLKQWIEEAFGVDDVYKAIQTLQGHDVHIKTAAAPSLKPPAIRLKLQPTSPTPSLEASNEAISASDSAQDHVRRGSKNLSRMNRPQDGGKSVDLKPKVPNQTPIATFWNFVDPFFKNIDETDMKFLDDPAKVFDPTPFTIPPLGKHYLEQWRLAYGYHSSRSKSPVGGAPPESMAHVQRVPTLKERLLAMLIHKDGSPDVERDDEILPSLGTDNFSPNLLSDDLSLYAALLCNNDAITQLNERIRHDLVEAGFLEEGQAYDHAEDDELCRELRNLQQELRKQAVVNNYRKRALSRRVQKYVGAQEFWSLMTELDGQVVQLYNKLAKASSNSGATLKKKKSLARGKSPVVYTTAQPSSELDEAILKLLDQRDQMMQKVGRSLPSRIDTLIPRESDEPLFDPQVEQQLIREAERSGSWIRHLVDPLPALSLSSSSIVSFAVSSPSGL